MKLAELRRARGLSQTDLSRQAGIAMQHISGLERGSKSNPTVGTLMALARVLRVAPVELMPELGQRPDETRIAG